MIDFKQMFNNIITYYSSNHLAYKKAVELLNIFDLKWELIQQKLE